MSEERQNRLRKIPKVDRVIEQVEWKRLSAQYGPSYAVNACRIALQMAKERILSGQVEEVQTIVEQELERALRVARLTPLQRVINATGVILHTNLGRATLSRQILQELGGTLSGPCNVELDLVTGTRGVRGMFVRETVARLCQAEDALVVNNNAAALLLTFSALAADREVIVSRGELIQIGGGFKIPEIIQQGGARLKEVGTTNITRLDDYHSAIGDRTGALLKVHLSNFHMDGFVRRPSTQELASLKTDTIPLIEDLGSGSLLTRFQNIHLTDPTPAQVLGNGADLVCFSGDKLLGSGQAGLIAGKRELIEKLARFPLMRAIRPDKVTYALLQTVLTLYERGDHQLLAPWKQLQQSRQQLVERIESFYERYGVSREQHPIVETEGEFGAGSMPGAPIKSAALMVANNDVDSLAEALRHSSPPIIGVVRDGRLLLDFLTIDKEDEPFVAEALKNRQQS